MNALRRLLRLRREDDDVKLALWMLLFFVWFLVDVLRGAFAYAVSVNKPVEYVLEAPSVSDAAVEALRARENVRGVSRQRTLTLTRGEKTVSVTELERSYLSDVCGADVNGTGHRFWMSADVFSSFFDRKTAPPVRSDYRAGDIPASGEFCLANWTDAEGYAVTCGTTKTLAGTHTLRVMLARGDPTGTDAQQLEGLGYTILNREQVLLQSRESELLLMRLGYGGAAAVFAAAAGWAFLKSSRTRRRWADRLRAEKTDRPDGQIQGK